MTCDVESAQQPLVKSDNKMPDWSKIMSIIKNDDVQELRKQVESESLEMVLMPQDSQHHRTVLHETIDSAAMECLDIILKERPTQEALDSPCDDGNTPLHIAIKNLNSIAVEKLLESGAYPNSRNDQGHSPLHLLAYKAASATTSDTLSGVMNCLNYLLKHKSTDVNALNNSKLTPLKAAVGKFPSKSSSLEQFCRKLIDAFAIVDEKTQNILNKHCVPNINPPSRLQMKKKEPLAEIYDLLINDQLDILHDRVSQLSSEEALTISNRFMGSKRIIYYLVDKCNEDGVHAFLKTGAKPWCRNMDGELPLHRALARGHHSIVNLLIEHMKKTNKLKLVNCKVDLREESFGLMQNALESRDLRSKSLSESDSNKCLRRLFESDVLVNVNQKENNDNETALHIAAAMNNQDAISILLQNGAFLGEHRIVAYQEDHGTVLNAVMAKTLEKTMDNCIRTPTTSSKKSEDDILDPNYTLEMNYGFLLPPTADIYSKVPSYHNEAAVLFDVGQSKVHRNTLKHPLIQTLLYAKWRRVLPLYVLNLIIYSAFVILFTVFLYTLKDLRILERKEANGNYTDHAEIEQNILNYRKQRGSILFFVLIFTIYMAIKEGFQIYFTYKTYYRCIENYLEWFLIFSVFITGFIPMPVDATRHLGAWAMIAAWYEFVLVLGRIPSLAIYITMLRHVSWNFLKLVFLFGFLIIAFSISFNIIMQPTDTIETGADFFAFWATLPRAVVMSTGEFEYSSISGALPSDPAAATSTVLIFLVFLFLIFLVLMNVMTGLAVTDTKEIVEDALLYSLKSRLELVYLNEQLFLKVGFMRRFLPKLQLLANQQRSLLVRINRKPKSERIVYEDVAERERTCRLDSRTSEVLRNHRLDRVAASKVTSETGRMLQLLEELMGKRNQ